MVRLGSRRVHRMLLFLRDNHPEFVSSAGIAAATGYKVKCVGNTLAGINCVESRTNSMNLKEWRLIK